jgi:DUF971 family protein
MSDKLPVMKRLERRDVDILVSYDNDQNFIITYDDIRYSCPCAKCSPQRNNDESSKYLRREVESIAAEKPKVKTVGKYAISFEWTSGCSSGIYRFERIWSLANKEDPDNGRGYVHGVW